MENGHIEHELLSRRIAVEGMVLLKNDGVLPLKDKKCALFGIGARYTFKGGTGSGDVNTFHNVSIEEGMENAGFENTAKYYLDESDEVYKERLCIRKKEIRRKTRKMSMLDWGRLMWVANEYPTWIDIDRLINEEDVKKSGCDTAMYVISRQAGEGGDRKNKKGDYYLTDTELANVKFIAGNFKNSILILNTAAPVDLKEVTESGIGAIVLYGQAGQEGGNALWDLLSGKENFSGKLSVSWPGDLNDLEISKDYSYLDGNTETEKYYDDIYVGYRYYESFGKKPLYPFGYGLSYTDFSADSKAEISGNECKVNVKVTNIGSCPGKEVVQCYVSATGLDVDKEFQSLTAFGKTDVIDPGKSQDIELGFDILNLATFDEKEHKFVLKKGTYTVKTGNSSDNQKSVLNIVIDKDYDTRICHHIVKKEPELEKLVPTVKSVADASVPVVSFVPEISVKRPGTVSVDTSVCDGIDIKDMCRMVVGVMPLSTKGAAGTVGETPKIFEKHGYRIISMADGPAGLRLSKEFYHKRNGINKGTVLIPEDLQLTKGIYEVVNKVATFSFAKKLRQFTTAFPVSIMRAQTFNTGLLTEMGRAVGEEMKEFGVDIWLAPAMNIIRHPLCGRAFEYYSEDPVLSGLMAKAESIGVKTADSKKTVCIKHFCCNSQEDNRMKTDSIVSERALREIYMKGFGIALDGGNVRAVMTSYNKVNGTYVNSNEDFVDGFLREDHGFDGIVMTDWQSVGKGRAVGHEVISSGNDIIMFGGKEISDEILNNAGSSLPTEQLKNCVSRLIAYSKSIE